MQPTPSSLRTRRVTPLALAGATIFELAQVPALATTHVVSSCDDSATAVSTPGTLRYEIKYAGLGETVSIGVLPAECASTITLEQGEITIAQPGLTVSSSVAGTAIDGQHGMRIFRHQGTGTLEIDNLTLRNGKYYAAQADGGCIYSAGSVRLFSSTVTGCVVRQPAGATGAQSARGGGIFSLHDVQLYSSSVSANGADASLASGTGSAGGLGAGLYLYGNLTAFNSTIDGNVCLRSSGNPNGKGGGALFGGSLRLYYSTVSNNVGDRRGGIGGGNDLAANFIVNSTVSGNRATNSIAGIGIAGTTSVSNSTFAFNVGGAGIGLACGTCIVSSSILADNDGYFDLSVATGGSLSGADNLVVSSNVASPAITVTADPHLAPLANHGGPTRTHALLPGSPALALGNNDQHLLYDQRGDGFDRTGFVLSTVYTDIGAYQVQMFGDDEIFYDGFHIPGG